MQDVAICILLWGGHSGTPLTFASLKSLLKCRFLNHLWVYPSSSLVHYLTKVSSELATYYFFCTITMTFCSVGCSGGLHTFRLLYERKQESSHRPEAKLLLNIVFCPYEYKPFLILCLDWN